MEASAIQAGTGVGRTRVSIGTPLLRLRSDQQLVAVFRAGNDDAFRVIHDRYRQRLLAYMRQMIPSAPSEAEDLLQEVFVRAYRGLRSNDRELSLRPWLYRVARNRCVDELRRPSHPPTLELLQLTRPREHDPVVESEQRESLRRLVTDVGRLPEQQRSALLLRELSGMSYAHVADVLQVSVPAVKSLLVRARISLAQALEARDTACIEIREKLALAHDQGVRPNALARRHLRDCAGCREYRNQVRGLSKQLAALAPSIGPLGLIAKLLGVGSGTSGSAAAGGAAAGGAAATTSGAVASAGLMGIGAGHVTALVAAAVITAGGAVDLATRSAPAPVHHARAAARPAAHHLARAAAVRVAPPQKAHRTAAHHAAGAGPGSTAGSASSGGSAAQAGRSSGGVSSASSNSSTGGADTYTQGGSGSGTAGCTTTTTANSSGGVIVALVTSVTQPAGSENTPSTTTATADASSNTATTTAASPSTGTAACAGTATQPAVSQSPASTGSGQGAQGDGQTGASSQGTSPGTQTGSSSGGIRGKSPRPRRFGSRW